MALNKETMGIVTTAKKWLISVLDPDHEVKVAELEGLVRYLAAGHAELSKCVETLTNVVLKDLTKEGRILLKADTIVIGDNNSIVNVDNRLTKAERVISIESIDSIQASNNSVNTSSEHKHIFANDDEEIERMRKLYPRGDYRNDS